MSQSLLVAVRFHEGRYHGQDDRFGGKEGWPPSPGRLFQALVAAAARGARLREEDLAALNWLERLAPPRVAAPAARRGRPVKLYVPSNDLDSVSGDPDRIGKIRDPKTWRPSFFDQEEPVLYVWDFESGKGEAKRICAVAARLYQLGRGIDMAWARAHVVDRDQADTLLESHCGPVRRPTGNGETATPTRGTLASLVTRYERNRTRLTTVGVGRKSTQLFTKPPLAFFARTGYDAPARRLHFELRGTEGAFSPRPLSSASLLVVGLVNGATRRLQAALPSKAKEIQAADPGPGCRTRGSRTANTACAHSLGRNGAHGTLNPACLGRSPRNLPDPSRRLGVGIRGSGALRSANRGSLARKLGLNRRCPNVRSLLPQGVTVP